MPTIDSLSRKRNKKFKPSTYRPWNYMDEIEKEENEKALLTKSIDEPEFIPDNNKDINRSTDDSSINSNVLSDLNVDATNIKPIGLHVSEKAIEINKSGVNQKSIRSQSMLVHLSFENSLDLLYKLSGKQKDLFFFIFECCINRGMLSTGYIANDTLVSAAKTTMKTIKKLLVRLINKDLIIREKGKSGRGGLYCFSIKPEVRNAAIEYKRSINPNDFSGSNRDSSLLTQSPFYNDSLASANKTLPDDWANIDIEPLKNIGFSKNHLIQLYKLNRLGPTIIQDSINYFAYDLSHNNKKSSINSDILNYFMGIITKRPYASPANYVSVEEEAFKIYKEAKEREAKLKQKCEDDAREAAMKEWLANLTKEEFEEFKGTGEDIEGFSQLRSKIQETLLSRNAEKTAKEYFQLKVWPEKRKEILS